MTSFRWRLFVFAILVVGVSIRGTSQQTTMDRRVSVLIEETTRRNTEQKAFADLEALGCPAVPAIIRLMDDRRNLPDRQISLRNKSPEAFEGTRHYGPEEVVDALAAILNQVTGQDFGFIFNGAMAEERSKAVKGWREFLASTPTSKLCEGG
jgi:hypothetical protein